MTKQRIQGNTWDNKKANKFKDSTWKKKEKERKKKTNRNKREAAK